MLPWIVGIVCAEKPGIEVNCKRGKNEEMKKIEEKNNMDKPFRAILIEKYKVGDKNGKRCF